MKIVKLIIKEWCKKILLTVKTFGNINSLAKSVRGIINGTIYVHGILEV